jgi:hypothetical protein
MVTKKQLKEEIQKQLKEQLQEQLNELNQKVNDAIQERTKFLDENMHDFAEFQIGDYLTTASGGRYVCIGHYRYHAHQRRPDLDNSLYCDCQIRSLNSNEEYKDWKTSTGSIDNTSRFAGVHPWYKVGDTEARKRKQKSASTHYNW